MPDIRGKHIVIIGGAKSGVAAASLLRKHGASVFVSDVSALSDASKKRLEAEEIPYEEMGHTALAERADMAVLSPGVPDTTPVIRKLLSDNIPVYSEIEVASWFNKSPCIAVTGSNGKTTVTSWLAHTWKRASRPFIMAGNIGYAYSNYAGKTGPDTTAILEVSSFQLDHSISFRPDISIILNITPDHLNRYNNDFSLYARSKFRLTEHQTASDTFIYNFEDSLLAEFAETVAARPDGPRLLAFSDKQEVPQGAFIRDNTIILKFNKSEEPLMQIDDIGIPGRHNLNNGLATALAARVSEIRSETIRESLKSFEGVEHRLELVRTYKGIRYINDSKATNINAVWYALDSFNMPIVLILGGRDKGNDYTELEQQIKEKVHTVIAIGEASMAIRKQIGHVPPDFFEVPTLKEAVKMAAGQARRGEIVLLSPACASFDMFDSYEHRGEVFKQAVLEL